MPGRLLDPISRISEILFGLIMALTFTTTLSAATAGRDEIRTLLAGAIGCNIAWGLVDAVMYLLSALTEQGRARLETGHGDPPHLTKTHWLGAVAVFLLVFLSTLPVVIPFLVFTDVPRAIRVSNAVAIALLFAAGFMLARHGGYNPWKTGVSLVALGVVLVGIAVALGG